MLRLLFLLLLPALLSADERWVVVRSGPFQVFSSAGDKAAREQMNRLEQFRHALGTALGKDDLHLVWPMRLLITKGQQPAAAIALARDAYVARTPESIGLAPALQAGLARLLIQQNTPRLPAEVESGLIALFSTLEVSGTHITLGAPPAARTREWARMHLLNTDPAYAGRTRVLISNLQQGSDLDVAYKNAYEKTAAQLEKQVDAYLAAGRFETASVSGRTLSVARDLHVYPAEADAVKLASADLLLASGDAGAAAAYNAIHGPEAAEGLALIALQAGNKPEAARMLASAIESGSKSARAWCEAARLQPEPAKARKQLEKAAELNPLWADPFTELARIDTDLDRKSADLKKATALDPRNAESWQLLAKTETEATRFIEAQKAWGGAERAAATPQERERIRQVRLELQGERADHEAAERRRKAEEEARDLERVKNESMAAIHRAEASANKKLNPDGTAAPKAVEWWSGPDAPGKLEGSLLRVDCLGRQARLTIQPADGKPVQLLVRDPGQIVLSGAGQMTLGCGPQKPPRSVVVMYAPKPDRKMGTAGEVASVEFR